MTSSGAPEVLPDQLRLVLVEGSLEMGREEAVHHVHAGREAEFGHPAQDERLVGRLLGVLAEGDDPPRVERAVDVVVSAVHVQRVLGQGARRNLQHHRGALARRVVVLLDAVDDALARRVVDDALPADRVGDGAALGGVFAFRLDRNRVAPEDVQSAFGERLLEELSAFRRRGDRIEDAGLGDAGFRVVGDELVAVGRDADPGIAGPIAHRTPFANRNRTPQGAAGATWRRRRPDAT